MADGFWWEPLSVAGVRDLFEGLAAPWWLAGGYALETFVGHAYREHGDIDVAVFRDDQRAVHDQLSARGWEAHAADPPGMLRRWREGESLSPDVHDIWCREASDGPWRLQLMLEERSGDDWVYRRDSAIRRPVSTFGWQTPDGMRVIAPEVQLLYKARSTSRSQSSKGERDFEVVAPRLPIDARNWLLNVLVTDALGHPWLDRLG